MFITFIEKNIQYAVLSSYCQQAIMPEERESVKHAPKCPKCGSSDIRRSKSDGFYAVLQRIFGRWPFRCRSCRVRFYRSADAPPEENPTHD